MIIKKAEFVKSSTQAAQCPGEDWPEYAFIGRSNVGKSSLINALLSRKNLAKTSSTPGKTQLINHFLINEAWFLVDLPGYGYAKVSKEKKRVWSEMIDEYLKKRKQLRNVFQLIDSRIEPQLIDLDFTNWLGSNEVPFALVFTKADKISPNQVQSNVAAYKRSLRGQWEELPPIFVTSSVSRLGRDEILAYIDRINRGSLW